MEARVAKVKNATAYFEDELGLEVNTVAGVRIEYIADVGHAL